MEFTSKILYKIYGIEIYIVIDDRTMSINRNFIKMINIIKNK
jgi:hypothetical protein